MKLKSIYVLLLAAILFAACSDDSESWNSGNATVSMQEQELTVKENKGIFNVPVVVTGEQNNPIRVTVEVTEAGTNPAMDDVHYIVTSKTIVIPANSKSGTIEIVTVDDDGINELRTFSVKIVAAEGATIGESTTLISIRDNDSVFYEKLQGKWQMSSTEGNWDVEIVGYDEDHPLYNKTLFITGILGYSWTTAELAYNFDMTTKKGSLEILYGTIFAEGVSFTGLGVMDIFLGTVAGQSIVLDGSIEGSWNDEMTQISFDNAKTLWGFLAPTGTGDLTGSYWFGEMTNIILKKK